MSELSFTMDMQRKQHNWFLSFGENNSIVQTIKDARIKTDDTLNDDELHESIKLFNLWKKEQVFDQDETAEASRSKLRHLRERIIKHVKAESEIKTFQEKTEDLQKEYIPVLHREIL